MGTTIEPISFDGLFWAMLEDQRPPTNRVVRLSTQVKRFMVLVLISFPKARQKPDGMTFQIILVNEEEIKGSSLISLLVGYNVITIDAINKCSI